MPHVVAVTAGSEVRFPNEDPFFHNVFPLSRPATFDLGRFPPGTSRSRVFRRPGGDLRAGGVRAAVRRQSRGPFSRYVVGFWDDQMLVSAVFAKKIK